MFFDNISKGQHVHMIGIGGISMSGLAEILLKWGYKVSGSDIKPSEITKKLQKSGIEVYVPHDSVNVEGADAIVYSAAIKQDNPELVRAKQLNLPIIDRATFLGEITRIYPRTVAVSGTHGKTTTTSMVAVTLSEANLDPTILVGGEVSAIGGNYKIGSSEFLVTEACEYVESFLKFYPYAGVVLNIEPDHLDYFTGIDHVKSAFEKFINRIPPDGIVIGNFDDSNVREIFQKAKRDFLSFGLDYEEADWKAANIVFNSKGCAKFDAVFKGKCKGNVQLLIPGIHNIYNALACIAVSFHFGIRFSTIKSSLEKFTGAKRRFEFKGIFNDITIVDDYAHHPSEVKATLKAAAGRSPGSLWCIFQPHTYTRTKALLSEFSTAFQWADKVIVLDIYAAREANTGQIHSKDLVNAINKVSNNAEYAADFEEAAKFILNQAAPGDLVLTMGAGDVYMIGEILLDSNSCTNCPSCASGGTA